MTFKNAFGWTADFEPLPFGPYFDVCFVKRRTEKIAAFLVEHHLLKSRWQVVGFMMNYKPREVIFSIEHLIKTEFPDVKITYTDNFAWNKNLYGSAGGAIKIFLDFKSDADEAEFIMRGNSILEIVKDNKDLIRTS